MAKTEKELTALRDDLTRVAERLERLAGSASDEYGDEAKAQFREVVERMKERFTDTRERARDAAKKADAYVHEHPWQTAAIAAAVGAVVALLVAKHRD